jgi:predicted N-acetyltransferase YhbS
MESRKNAIEDQMHLAIRKYREGDEKEILELRKICFGYANLDEWIWEFKSSPLGSLTMVAESSGHIVGSISYVFIRIKVGNEIFKGSIVCDAMVHPNFRRRGLWHTLSRSILEEAKKQGVSITYSFTSKVTYKHRLKGMIAVCRVPILVKFFDTYGEIRRHVRSKFVARIFSTPANFVFRVLYRVKKCPSIENLTLTEIREFDDRINTFWSNISKNLKIAVVRDKNYLNWRYFQRPHSHFRVLLAEGHHNILGYIVFSVQRTFYGLVGYLIDIMVLPERPDAMQLLVSTAIDELQKENSSLILCKMMKKSVCYNVIKESGFIGISGSHLTVRTTTSKISQASIEDPNNWYLTFGDSDGILLELDVRQN